MSKWFQFKDQLIQDILVEHKSYEEVGKKFGCSGANIKKVMKLTLNINLPSRRRVNECEIFKGNRKKRVCAFYGKPISTPKKFCNINCQTQYYSDSRYNKILNGDESIMRANYSPKPFKNRILKEQGNKCAICGIEPTWNNKPLVFILDHIDGHAANNRRDNLRCICPNCDSQLDTYKSKNKNGDRYYYRYGKFKRSAQEETLEVELP